ncbi:hypothetical protein [Candidatus Uabimicrobium sp. HlEnr_7]|uniref:hypothetical protein n=1 Tax=Candidatus Uabimicrobium helgolandensis TaxID=3095367 RepID=UPI003558F8B0
MNDKAKKITLLSCLLFCIAFVSVWRWNRHQEWQIRKNVFCAHEILRNIWNEQSVHLQKSNKFFDFSELRKITKNELLQKLTDNIENGIVKRHGYHFCIYLLSGKSNIYISGKERLGNKAIHKNFICYAWPIKRGETGKFAFAIDCGRDLYMCRNSIQKYSADKKPFAKACFRRKKLECNDNEFWVTAGSDFWFEHGKQQQSFICD